MKTLNLTSLDNSDIKYKKNEFPDGQRDIVIENFNFEHIIHSILKLNIQESVQIKSRLNNMEDLGLIVCAAKALRNLGVKEIHLYTPWIMGLRSDRLFVEGGVRYIKDVLAPILNSLNFESVTCYDAHSYVAENCINNLKIIDNEKFVRRALDTFLGPIKLYSGGINSEESQFIIIASDAGALHKIYKLAEKIGYKGDIITCSKERDTKGKLTKTVVPIDEDIVNINFNIKNKDFIIIDDICDGGGTFINIAKNIKDKGLDNKIYLIVTHGIFSKGFEELSKYFDGIYCTNSYSNIKNWQEENGKIFVKGDFVKQLNVF
jgi:ribose-phosphate pyrophosphokinase